MVNQKIVLLALAVLLILAGCTSGNVKPVVPTATAIIPLSTPIPTETKTLAPAATVISPTPTLYLTPLQTLSVEESFNQLYEFENKCDVPCWWGIIPGVSTWTETKQFIEHFNPSRSFGVDKINPRIPITKSTQSETYVWYVWLPDSDSAAGVYLEVQNNVVTAIRVTQDLFVKLFPIDKFFEVYGKPDKVLVYVSDYDKNNSRYDAFTYLVYEKKHIFAEYVYWGSEMMSSVNLCLRRLSPQEMYLWSSGVELSMDFSNTKPLDEFSKLNPYTFYEKFKDKNNQCFELSKDAWK